MDIIPGPVLPDEAVSFTIYGNESIEFRREDGSVIDNCCDGTGWTGNEFERCTEHYEPLDSIWFSR